MMKRSPEEIAALRESFRKMDTAHKLEHIYTYHKWTILLILVAVYMVGNFTWRAVTKKNPVLYVGYVNVSVGEDLQQVMTDDFLAQLALNPKKNEVQAYTGLYLSDDPSSEDHQYAYASRLKLMAAVNAKQLDAVLMNREAYDLLSHSGYLLQLDGLPAPLLPWLTENEVILESNAIEVQLNTAGEYRAVTRMDRNALEVTAFPLFRDAGFGDTVYIGILANTLHYDTTVTWLEYLLAA